MFLQNDVYSVPAQCLGVYIFMIVFHTSTLSERHCFRFTFSVRLVVSEGNKRVNPDSSCSHCHGSDASHFCPIPYVPSRNHSHVSAGLDFRVSFQDGSATWHK